MALCLTRESDMEENKHARFIHVVEFRVVESASQLIQGCVTTVADRQSSV
jgi:hypothetical protein